MTRWKKSADLTATTAVQNNAMNTALDSPATTTDSQTHTHTNIDRVKTPSSGMSSGGNMSQLPNHNRHMCYTAQKLLRLNYVTNGEHSESKAFKHKLRQNK